MQIAYEAWRNALAGGEGMAGCDDSGVEFARQYDDAAGQVAQVLHDLDTAIGQVQTGLDVCGYNHAVAEWAARAGAGSAPEMVSTAPAATGDYAQPVSAFGGSNADYPPGLELFADLLWSMWPQGDVDALTRAVAAWRSLSGDLGDIAAKLRTVPERLDGAISPEVALIEDRVAALVEGTRAVSDSVDEVADALYAFTSGPDGIEQTVAASWAEVESTAVEVTATIGISLVATFITAGASDIVGGAVAAGRVAMATARIISWIAGLGIRVGALAGRAGVVVARVLGAGQKFQAVVVRAGTLVGRELTVMTGGSVNSMAIEGVMRGKDADYGQAALWGAGGAAVGDAAGHLVQRGMGRLPGHVEEGLAGPGKLREGADLAATREEIDEAARLHEGAELAVTHESLESTVEAYGRAIRANRCVLDGEEVILQVQVAHNRFAALGARRVAPDAAVTRGGDPHVAEPSEHRGIPPKTDRRLDPLDPTFVRPEEGPERVRPLSVDPDLPCGRDAFGRPLTEAEYHRLYSSETYDEVAHRYPPIYPPDDGMVLGSGRIYSDLEAFKKLNPTITLDRIGEKKGRFFGLVEDGIPASVESRSMEPRALRRTKQYSQARLADRFPPGTEGWLLQTSRVAPWFGQPGGAGQAVILKPIGLRQITNRSVLARVRELGLRRANFHQTLAREFPLSLLYEKVTQEEALQVGIIVEIPLEEKG